MELAESLQKPLHFTTEQAGKSFIGTVFPLKSIPDCCLYFQQPQDILYARIRFLRNLVLALSFGILLICLFLGRRFAGSIIDPLLNLIGFMETTKEGRLDTKISTTIGLSEGNEIDKLGSHYEKMVSRISEMFFRLELFSFLQSEISDGDETEPEKLRRKMLDHIINALVKRYQADFGLLGFFEQGLSEQSIDYACTGSGGICYKEKLLDELLRQREELCHKYQQIMPDEKTADGFNIIFLGLDETINYPSLSGNECLILYVSRNFPVYQLSLHGLLCLCLPPGRFDSEQTAALSDSVESICARSLSIIVKSWLDELKKDAQKGWEIQESLMPGVVPDAGGALDIACYYLSSLQKLAGDYYDFLMMADKPEVVVCTIADVSGKGIGASLFGASAKSFLQALDFTGLSTGHILQKLNQELVEISDRISSNGGSDMFLTMFIAAIDTGNDLLHYSSGGHNRMFLLHGENRSIEELSAKGLPLGMFSGAVYESKTVPFVKGDSLLLYTDGVTEMENADLELFGYERLREFCHQQAHCPAKEFVDRLSQDFDEYRSGVLPSDDITIVQIRNQRVSG
jgi:serine phosphatase RsbU (regulator of sigma subunit)